jgi:hypothetical protein
MKNPAIMAKRNVLTVSISSVSLVEPYPGDTSAMAVKMTKAMAPPNMARRYIMI